MFFVSRRRPKRRRRSKRSTGRTQRTWLLLGVGAIVIFGVVGPTILKPAVRDLRLPLRHEEIIRGQATTKQLDPALIAAVIYAESRFRPRTSSAGAKGLMQILPSTADFIARKSGGSSFVEGDLATPEINIAYGSYYLRYLVNSYEGNLFLAIAAYNAGQGRVNQWQQQANQRGEKFDSVEQIPFVETREYVQGVLAARKRYKAQYADRLGI